MTGSVTAGSGEACGRGIKEYDDDDDDGSWFTRIQGGGGGDDDDDDVDSEDVDDDIFGGDDGGGYYGGGGGGYYGGGGDARTKATHIAQVFYQLIDNDADGVPDDPVHLKHMVNNGYLLWVPLTEEDDKNAGNWPDEVVDEKYFMIGIFEAEPGTCDSPANRGADPKDRNTWAAVVENTQGCEERTDATIEEIHHLMATAAGELWPDLWGPSFKSEAGKAIELTNGNCGWGFKENWIYPASNKCEGQFAYDDETCDEACIVVEGIYWASVSYIGGLYTKKTADDNKSEWLMATPNDGMTIYPKSVTNAKPLQCISIS